MAIKRSQINRDLAQAIEFFDLHGIRYHQNVDWDRCNFGDGFKPELILVNVITQKNYWKKLMFLRAGAIVPLHTHPSPDGVIPGKIETIIVLVGRAKFVLHGAKEDLSLDPHADVSVIIDNNQEEPLKVPAGSVVLLEAGQQITLYPGDYHQFEAVSPFCILEEVSTWNDDWRGNLFANFDPAGRFATEIEEDETPLRWLVSDSLEKRRDLIGKWGRDHCPPLNQGLTGLSA